MKNENQIHIRKSEPGDIPIVIDFITATGFFRPVEIEVAAEVIQEASGDDADGSYHSYVVEVDGRTGGWICFGSTPCTLGTFDIYWIAVDPNFQRLRLGTRLLEFAEEKILGRKGRLVVIETSGSKKYIPTQRFYEKNGYRLAAAVDDFYAPEDPKLIFTKTLGTR